MMLDSAVQDSCRIKVDWGLLVYYYSVGNKSVWRTTSNEFLHKSKLSLIFASFPSTRFSLTLAKLLLVLVASYGGAGIFLPTCYTPPHLQFHNEDQKEGMSYPTVIAMESLVQFLLHQEGHLTNKSLSSQVASKALDERFWVIPQRRNTLQPSMYTLNQTPLIRHDSR